MILLNSIAVGLKEIWAHKSRSFLTMLGIILGVTSLVGMSAIIKGMENGMKETMVAMGGVDKVLVRPQAVPAWQDHLADSAPGRTLVDVEALRRSAPLHVLLRGSTRQVQRHHQEDGRAQDAEYGPAKENPRQQADRQVPAVGLPERPEQPPE